MIKFYYFGAILLALTITNRAIADCSTALVPDASATLLGNTVCTNDSQEEHRTGDELWDYKKGSSDLVDPRKKIGTWVATGSQVTYNYTNGSTTSGPYIFNLHTNGGNSFSLCGVNVGTNVDVTLIPTIDGTRVCPDTIYDAPTPP